MGELSKLINISKVSESKLNAVGINTISEFKTLGSREAYLRVRTYDDTACICMLYGFEGAIQGIKWHMLPKSVKKELLKFYNEL